MWDTFKCTAYIWQQKLAYSCIFNTIGLQGISQIVTAKSVYNKGHCETHHFIHWIRGNYFKVSTMDRRTRIVFQMDKFVSNATAI